MTILAALVASTAVASAAPNRDPLPPPTDYWQDKGFILMAHQGGEWDFPPNTLFAYKSAMANGADMIDMDAYVTADGKIVLTHDLDARKNSNLTDEMFEGRHDINDLTLAELKTLDFAYKWSPRDGSASVPWRGIATGSVTPPDGFTANDFKIPTFDEVLDAFPNTPINIELKQVAGVDIEDTAETMAQILADHPGHDENVIINSFGQEMLDAMAAARPQHKSYSGSQSALLGYITGGEISPRPVALEPPDFYKLKPDDETSWVRTVPILKSLADYDGYKIYVWGSDHDPMQDTDEFYAKLISEGADSYNTPSPLTLAKYLCENGIASADGTPRCAEQVCPEGQTGIAPDNCVPINCPDGQEGTPPDDCHTAVCPKGQEGTPPDCQPIPVPAVKVKQLTFKPKKGKIKAGKKRAITLVVKATGGKASKVTIRLKSSNRKVKVPAKVTVRLKPKQTVKRKIVIRAKRNARGKAKITASSGKVKAKANCVVNPLYNGSGQAGSNPLYGGKRD
jgi:glycerophosphoryl diester phosphodiesterase